MRSVRRTERIAAKVIHIEKNRQISCEEAEYLITDVTEQPVRRPNIAAESVIHRRLKSVLLPEL